MMPSPWERPSSLINRSHYHIYNASGLKKLGLFALLAIWMLSSCKKPEESLGENLQPLEDLLNAEVTDSIHIVASTEKVDSLLTDIFANVLLGNYVDPDFGVVKARAVMQFSPDLTADSLPDNIEIYSVVLSLAYQNEAYGNNAPMYFSVNELMENIYLDSAYYSNDLVEQGTQNLILPGNETQETRPEYASSVSGSTIQYLHLPLKTDLGERLLAVDSMLEDFTDFTNYFKGLVIGSQTIDGRVLSFSTIDSKITVNYRYEEDRVTRIGTYTFNYTSSCEGFSLIDHQYYNTPLSAMNLDNSIEGELLCYMQSAGGTRIRLDISDALWLGDQGDVTINKAELVIPFDADSKFAEIDSLALVYETDTGVFLLTRDYYRNPGGNFRKAEGYYRFNITSHMQSLMNGEITNNELVIVSRPRFVGYYNSMGTRRSLLHGPGFDASDPTQNMRIVVTYSY